MVITRNIVSGAGTRCLLFVLGIMGACAFCKAADGPIDQPKGNAMEGKSYLERGFTPQADLPPLFELLDGTPVRSDEDLERRREEIRDLWCDIYLGRFPEQPPKLLEALVLEENRPDDGSTRRRVRLTLDTPNRKSFEIRVWTPKAGGPRPLLLTQPRAYQLVWAEEALRRGYVACLYPGVDYNQPEPDFPGYESVWEDFRDEYPEASWFSSLAIQAWLGSRALDYLLDPGYGYEIDSDAVGIIGFSRYGKQSIYAAAFDPRITAVIARSSGSPTACGYRFTSRQTCMESVLDAPTYWMLPGVENYFGREHELPIEGHGLLALIAPRPCQLHTAHNDGCDPTFGVERAYLEGKKWYERVGAAGNLYLRYRTGQHGPITDAHVRDNLDWFDMVFGRGDRTPADFPEELLHAFDWEAWKRTTPPADLEPPFESPRPRDNDDRRRRIEWMLGQPPVDFGRSGPLEIRQLEGLGVEEASRDRWKPGGVKRVPVAFGENVQGNVMFRTDLSEPAPVVIWIHPYNYSQGYNEGYGVEGNVALYYWLAQRGCVVLCYDQTGFGDRLLESPDFYERCPRWSRLGRMVHDVRRALDFIEDGDGISEEPLPEMDADCVYALGYAMGGIVALYAAALDDRIAGAASFCGFTPMRTDTDARSTGGVRRLWEWHALLPKLGLYNERETELPYDYDDVLRLIAPRPCLVHAPQRDRFATVEDVKTCVERARPAWESAGCAERLTIQSPDDTNRFQRPQQEAFFEWLRRLD